MASNRSRSNRSVGNKLNNLDSRVSSNEKGTNNPHLSPDVIEEQHLTDGAVAEEKLADRAVTEDKIARGAVGTEHLGIVNTITADSGLVLKPGPSGGYVVIDGASYAPPAAGSGTLYALGYNENKQVVVSTSGIGGGGNGMASMPAGSIQPWPTRTAPAGWLVCDGSAVSRTTYADLFATLNVSLGAVTFSPISSQYFYIGVGHGLQNGDSIYFTTTGSLPTGVTANTLYYVTAVGSDNVALGTTRTITTVGYSVSTAVTTTGTGTGAHTMWHSPYGNGNGTTTFNLPDIRGRAVVGSDTSQGEFAALGEMGGAKTHSLLETEMPSHSHTGYTTSGGTHDHLYFMDDGAANHSTRYNNTGDYDAASNNTSGGGGWFWTAGGSNSYNGYHNHNVSTNNTGGNQAHNNLQPYIALTYIIKHMVADGMQGPQGIQGVPGNAATVSAGTTTTGAPGSVATVTNAGTTSAAVFNFTIPRGDTGAQGVQGNQGPSGTITVGSTSTGAEGTDAQVTNSGTSTNAVLEFVVPRGNAATVAVGTTTNPDYGNPAAVTNTGDGHAAIFNFAIPKGRAATATAGTTSTLSEDSSATVTNAGTVSDAVFNFSIPQGKTGNPAGVEYQFSTSVTDADPGNGYVRVNNATPASITSLFIDNLDVSGSDQTTWYQQWDDTTNIHGKGYLYLAEYRTNNVLVLRITGSVAGAAGYYKVPVAYVSGALPVNSANTFISYSQSGDQGVSVPAGGSTGQILAKDSNSDYAFVWIDNYADWTSQVKHKVKAAEALTLGQAVYVSGSDGTNMLVSKASNAAELTSSKTMGLIMQTLATNGQGFVITEGLISNLDTSTATLGDPVWLGTNGGLIYGLANRPVAPAHLVFLGVVTRVNNSVGEIWVKVQNGYELNELHDVLISNPQNGQALTYDSASGLWKNSTPASTLDSLTDVTITSPQDKQVLKYDAATSQWKNAIATGGVTVSATAPASPYPGDAWFDTTDGLMYVYYTDVDSSAWIEVAANSALATALEGRVGVLETNMTTTLANDASLAARATALETRATNSEYKSPNYLINGDFEINQRGFSSTTTALAYGFDRWKFNYNSGSVTYSAQSFTPGAAPVAGYEGRNFARYSVAGQSGTGTFCTVEQPIEDVRTLAGRTVTVSFWAKAASGTPKVAVELYQWFGTGGTPSADGLAYAGQVTISTSWQRYSITGTVPSLTGKTVGTSTPGSLTPIIWLSSGSQYDSRNGSLGIQSNTFDFWGIQIEQGTSATAFRRNTNNPQAELAACQRYFQRVYDPKLRGVVGATNTVVERTGMPLPVQMRTTPSVALGGTITFWDGSTTGYVSSVRSNFCTYMMMEIDFNLTAAMTSYRPAAAYNNGNSPYVDLSAEL